MPRHPGGSNKGAKDGMTPGRGFGDGWEEYDNEPL